MPLRPFLDVILEGAALRNFLFEAKKNRREESMPYQKTIREIPGAASAAACAQAGSRPGRRRESDRLAYKGRPAARPVPPPKAPAPPPKQTPAEAPGVPKPPAPAKEADAGQK
jgi:hypothetical protein